MTIVEGNVPLSIAAEILGISVPSVKGGLLSGTLPIGGAWKNADSSHDMFHISPQRLADYEGYTKDEILEIVRERSRETA